MVRRAFLYAFLIQQGVEPLNVVGRLQFYIGSDNFLPQLVATSPPALEHIWPYAIDYGNSLDPHTRPSIIADPLARPLSGELGGLCKCTKVAPARSRAQNAAVASHRLLETTMDLDDLAQKALRIIYADSDIAVLDKPANILSVPGSNYPFSLASAAASVLGIDRVDRTVVHRLDEPTSGVLVFAMNPDAQSSLHNQFRDRGARKMYTAIVRGRCWGEGEIDLPLRSSGVETYQCVDASMGKPSLTLWRAVGWGFQDYEQRWNTRLELFPLTGRTHQLRVHLAAIGHPIVGDGLYGPPMAPQEKRLMLHATILEFNHPTTGAPMSFEAQCPF